MKLNWIVSDVLSKVGQEHRQDFPLKFTLSGLLISKMFDNLTRTCQKVRDKKSINQFEKCHFHTSPEIFILVGEFVCSPR